MVQGYIGNMDIYLGPLILNIGIAWRWVVSPMPQPISSWARIPWCPLNRRLDGPNSWSGCSEMRQISYSSWIQTSDQPAYSLVTILTTLSQLQIIILHRFQTSLFTLQTCLVYMQFPFFIYWFVIPVESGQWTLQISSSLFYCLSASSLR